ncbi:MAG: hypothetical protein WAX69_04115, partial [Victivallales bacterium]
MAMDVTGISNINEFYTDHYIVSILENDLKDLFAKWVAAEKEKGVKCPYERLRAMGKDYFRLVAELEKLKTPALILKKQEFFIASLLEILGYEFRCEQKALDDPDEL